MDQAVKNILVIRSCRKELFLTTLYRLKGQYPEASISIFILPKMQRELEDFPLYDEVITFPEESDLYHDQPDKKFVETVRGGGFDLGVITMNNRYGEAYDNIKRLMLKLGPRKVITINCFSEILDVNKIELSASYVLWKRVSVIFSTLCVYLALLPCIQALRIFTLIPRKCRGLKTGRVLGSLP